MPIPLAILATQWVTHLPTALPCRKPLIIDLSTLSRLESGKRRLALDHIPALLAALGVSADDPLAKANSSVAAARTTARLSLPLPVAAERDGPGRRSRGARPYLGRRGRLRAADRSDRRRFARSLPPSWPASASSCSADPARPAPPGPLTSSPTASWPPHAPPSSRNGLTGSGSALARQLSNGSSPAVSV